MNDFLVDDLARMSDEDALRREFHAVNVRRLEAVLWNIAGLLFIALMRVMPGNRSASALFVVDFVVNTAFLAFAWVLRKRVLAILNGTRAPEGLAALVARNPSSWITGYLAVQFVLMLIFSFSGDSWFLWPMLFAWLIVGLRLQTSELLLLHTLLLFTLAVGAFFAGDLTGSKQPTVGGFIATAFLNAIAFGVSVVWTRISRKQFLASWQKAKAGAMEQIRMREELRVGRELQLSMLPEAPPRLRCLDLSGISLPATEVGGDYYDFLPDEKGGVAIVQTDVAGHGLASGLMLAAMRGALTLLRPELHDPAAVLRRLHSVVTQTTRSRLLVTAVILLIDEEGREATLANAGHPPVILRRAGAPAELIELFSTPLGTRLSQDIQSRRFSLGPGDLLVLHSDGAWEAQNPAGEIYGLDRLLRHVEAQMAAAPADAVRDAILRDLAAFRAGAAQTDDVTLVVVRVL